MPNEKKSPEEKPARKATSKPKKSAAPKVAGSTAAKAAPKEQTAAACASEGGASSQSGKPVPSTADVHEEIRLRAYQIYCERGGQHGMHDADWQRAELEVRAKYGK